MHDRWAVLVAVCLSFVAASAWATAGHPDPTFGSGGTVVAPVGEYSHALSILRQPDGKLVVGGESGQRSYPWLRDMLVARFAADGSPDAGFGTNGVVLTPVAGRRSVARTVLRQPDGKIVAAGTLDDRFSFADLVVVRYQPDGTLDTGFGTGGIVILDLAGATDETWDAALQPDGFILIAGTTTGGTVPGTADGFVVRLDGSGALDPTFGTGGLATIDLGGRRDELRDLLLEPSGRMVLAGFTSDPLDPYSGSAAGAVIAMLPDGTLDPAFGTAGVAEMSVDLRTGFTGVARLSGGDLFLIGSGSADGINGYHLVARLHADGTPDAGFGGGDGVIAPADGGLLFAITAMPDDRILGTGAGFLWGHWGAIGTGRHLPDGSPDPTFGNGGVASVYPSPGDYYNAGGLALAVEPDGSAVSVAGFASPGPYDLSSDQARQLALARFRLEDTACSTDADCGICEHCGSGGFCARGPRAGCTRPAPSLGAKLTYAGLPVRPKIIWKWRSGVASPGFDPTAGDDLGLCMWWGRYPIYESTIPAGAGWRPTGTGVTFSDRTASAFGLTRVKVSRSTVQLKAIGDGIVRNPNGFPDALLQPADTSIALEVQLHASNGTCFAATYPQAALTGSYPQHVRKGIGF